MPTCGTPMLFFLLLVFENLEKKVDAAITTSAIASSAISLLYLHIINMPVHVIWRTTTSSVVAQLCRQVDVRRRTVCERALSQLSGLDAIQHRRRHVQGCFAACSSLIVWRWTTTLLDDAFRLSQEKTKNLPSFFNAFLLPPNASTVFCCLSLFPMTTTINSHSMLFCF